MAKIRIIPPSTVSDDEDDIRAAAKTLKMPDNAPSPPCQWPACHRRAQYVYRDRKTGLRVFRPWCKPHRPTYGRLHTPKTIRPRPYVTDPKVQGWGPQEKCPFCFRKREPKGDGTLRRTCKLHRGIVEVNRQLLRKPKPKPLPPKPPSLPAEVAPPSKPINLREVVYHEGRKREVIPLPPKDRKRLLQLFDSDAGIYESATDALLSRKYPTAAIAALFGNWARGRG